MTVDCRECVNLRSHTLYFRNTGNVKVFYCMEKIRRKWKNPTVVSLIRKKYPWFHNVTLYQRLVPEWKTS